MMKNALVYNYVDKGHAEREEKSTITAIHFLIILFRGREKLLDVSRH